VKLLGIVLAVQVAIGLTLVGLVATDNVPFVGEDAANGKAAPAAEVDNFDGAAAFRLLRRQVEIGPRPAGSPESRKLARLLKRVVPRGRYQEVPDGLRNVIGTVHGRERGYIVVAAHYDTKDLPGFVGANDGASGTAIVLQLARTLRRPRHSIKFVFLDGEETPRGTLDSEFLRYGVRGAKVAAPAFRDARAMILLDMVGDKDLAIRRESYSDARLWKRLRAAATRVGAGAMFPTGSQGPVEDDHIPFRREGVRPIDLIDFDFPCWHRRCDDLSAVSERSVDAVGETVYELLQGL
jgi:hypothetical protein